MSLSRLQWSGPFSIPLRNFIKEEASRLQIQPHQFLKGMANKFQQTLSDWLEEKKSKDTEVHEMARLLHLFQVHRDEKSYVETTLQRIGVEAPIVVDAIIGACCAAFLYPACFNTTQFLEEVKDEIRATKKSSK